MGGQIPPTPIFQDSCPAVSHPSIPLAPVGTAEAVSGDCKGRRLGRGSSALKPAFRG